MNAIVIVVDRLHLGYLGAYGSARVATPAIDRLAAEGFVFDQAYVESPEWERLYAAYWQGRHAMCPPPKAPGAGLIDCLSDGPVTAKLLTDDRQLADSSLARSFRETVFLDLPERDQPAATVDETRLASCFAAAIELVESTPSPFLLWCHLRGLSAPWDAPREFQLACHDEGDPEPSDSVAVPNLFLPPGYDPDELLAYDQAYAGQVALLDACFEAFLEGIENDPGKQSTLILTSARGFPMGEHSRVGACDRALYSELVHVPLLVRLPDGTGAADRSQALVEPVDLYSTLSDCLGVRCEPSLQGSSLLPILRGDTERIRDRVDDRWPRRRAGRSLRLHGTCGKNRRRNSSFIRKIVGKPATWPTAVPTSSKR